MCYFVLINILFSSQSFLFWLCTWLSFMRSYFHFFLQLCHPIIAVTGTLELVEVSFPCWSCHLWNNLNAFSHKNCHLCNHINAFSHKIVIYVIILMHVHACNHWALSPCRRKFKVKQNGMNGPIKVTCGCLVCLILEMHAFSFYMLKK